mmetsp:Transcript_84005/g.133141  ORF Transcript_84005/g.133141 Transcript_84005/m.133141 type:complete len:128 (+) Transcript_84005:400-783(+)
MSSGVGSCGGVGQELATLIVHYEVRALLPFQSHLGPGLHTSNVSGFLEQVHQLQDLVGTISQNLAIAAQMERYLQVSCGPASWRFPKLCAKESLSSSKTQMEQQALCETFSRTFLELAHPLEYLELS